MIDLCELGDVKEYLGIADADTSEDKLYRRLITATSRQFLNLCRRPGMAPAGSFTEIVRVANWQVDGQIEIFVSNWPINSVSSVLINDAALAEFDSAKPDTLGWVLDAGLADEERQFIALRGSCWPSFTAGSPNWPIYRQMPMRVEIAYNAGYSQIPEDIAQAVIEWIAYKKGLRELQSHDQTEQWVQLGQYQQNNMIAGSTMKLSEIAMPQSVADVISIYQRPVAP